MNVYQITVTHEPKFPSWAQPLAADLVDRTFPLRESLAQQPPFCETESYFFVTVDVINVLCQTLGERRVNFYRQLLQMHDSTYIAIPKQYCVLCKGPGRPTIQEKKPVAESAA